MKRRTRRTLALFGIAAAALLCSTCEMSGIFLKGGTLVFFSHVQVVSFDVEIFHEKYKPVKSLLVKGSAGKTSVDVAWDGNYTISYRVHSTTAWKQKYADVSNGSFADVLLDL